MKPFEMMEHLRDTQWLEYGQTVPSDVIINLLGHAPEEGWAFLGPYLGLKEAIENEGYFCTSSGLPAGALRILPLVEMTTRVDQIQKLMVKRQKRALNTMRNSRSDDLDGREREEHMHAINKLSIGLHALKSVLNY